MNDKVYLVDGSGYIFRAYYAVPPLTTKDGFPTNALYGFTRMLTKLLGQPDAKYVAVVFDSGAKTFRNELYKEYKANRKECPADLVEQMPLFRTISTALGLPVLELQGVEADDVIGTLTKRLSAHGAEVVIVSADKDLMQLVSSRVTIWDTMRDRRFDSAGVKEKFGVGPEKVVEALGLIGDDSDNVPGLRGCGPKTAVQLLEKFGTVEEVLNSVERIKTDSSIRNRAKLAEELAAHAEIVRLSRKLVEIDTNVPVTLAWPGKKLSAADASDSEVYAAMERRAPEHEMLRALVDKLEFGSLLGELAQSRAAEGPHTAGVVTHVVYADEFPAFLEKLAAQTEFAFDTETTSLDVLQADLIGASFCWSDGEAYYVPLGHAPGALGEGRSQLATARFIEGVSKVLTSAQVKKYGQNLKYDINVLARYGVEVQGIAFDTMVAAYVLNPDQSTYNLTALAADYLKKGTLEYDEVIGEEKNLASVEVQRAAGYACQDARYAWLLKRELAQRIKEQNLERVFAEIEMPLVSVLAAMERRGVKLDEKTLAQMSDEFGRELEKLKDKLHETAGGEFNLNSPKQLADVLFNRLGISTKGIKKTKTGISTDSSVLEKLRPEHPIADLLLQYRMVHKLKSTYIDALPAQISKISGRLHSRFNQTATGTGRLSSSEPNLQNIPVQTAAGRRIRAAFVAEEGRVLISADYSQIELRILAHISADKNLIDAFKNGLDIHAKTAREVFGIGAEAAPTPEQRRVGKTINFGVIYGMGAFRLARELGIPVSTASSYIDSYFARYPGVSAYFERTEEAANKDGFVTTLFGRKRIISGIDTSGRDQGFMLRAAINAPIQGSAADLIKISMNRLERRLKTEHVNASMIMQIHDELVFECVKSDVDRACPIIRSEMEGAVKLDVPLKVELGVGANWQEAHA